MCRSRVWGQGNKATITEARGRSFILAGHSLQIKTKRAGMSQYVPMGLDMCSDQLLKQHETFVDISATVVVMSGTRRLSN